MFENLSGADVPLVTQLMFGLMIAGGLIVAAACVARLLGAWRLGTTISRRRHPLLAVVDVAVVDGRRRLILIRRDNTEHLMMIGGPNDLLIEANIAAAAATPRQAQVTHPSASGDTPPPVEMASILGRPARGRPPQQPAPRVPEHMLRPEPLQPQPTPRLPEHMLRPEPPQPQPAPPLTEQMLRPEPPMQPQPAPRLPEQMLRPEPSQQAVPPLRCPPAQRRARMDHPLDANPDVRVDANTEHRASELRAPQRAPPPWSVSRREQPVSLSQLAKPTEQLSHAPAPAREAFRVERPPPRAASAPAPGPAAETEFGSSADKNFADMARQLEPALRRPPGFETAAPPARPVLAPEPPAEEDAPIPPQRRAVTPALSDAAIGRAVWLSELDLITRSSHPYESRSINEARSEEEKTLKLEEYWKRMDLRDLSASYERVGDVLVREGNLTEALQANRDSLAIRERLAKADPSNAGWQRDLSVSYIKAGDVLVAQRKLTEALQAHRDGLAIAERLAKADPTNAGWQRVLQFGIGRIGGIAYNFVLVRNFAMALETADQAISLAPDWLWLHVNRAHALMFIGRIEEARTLYLRHRGEKNMPDGRLWETVIREDFAELRKAGLTHQLMDEIERRFASGG